MSEPKPYTFSLGPGGKTRYLAGPFDVKTRSPKYEIEADIPSHVRNKLEITEVLLGNRENCNLAWDIKNDTTWPAFISIKKDGELINGDN